MNLLVTGGRGFIGRYVVAEAVRSGHSVAALLRPGSGSNPAGDGPPLPSAWSRATILEHDLTHADGLVDHVRGVDAVIHCAAAMGGDRDHQAAVTVEGTRNLLDAMTESGVSRLVLLSTFALYDQASLADHAVLDETTPLEDDFEARSPYVWAKREQEDLVRAAAAANGWTVAVLRPGVVYGPGRTWFYHLGVQARPTRWVSYGGAARFPITYVENCADAAVRALSVGAPGSVVTANIVDDAPPTRLDYMNVLADHAGAMGHPRPTITDVPWGALSPTAGLATWVNNRLLFGRAPLPDILRLPRLEARCKPLRYSNQHAKDVLGWQPQVDFAEGMRRSLD